MAKQLKTFNIQSNTNVFLEPQQAQWATKFIRIIKELKDYII